MIFDSLLLGLIHGTLFVSLGTFSHDQDSVRGTTFSPKENQILFYLLLLLPS